jgi:hypothetical protein
MKGHPYPCARRLNIVKMAILPKPIYRLDTVRIRIPASFFVEIDKLIPNHMKTQGTYNSQNNLEKRIKLEGSHFFISNLLKTYRIKTV